MVSQRGPEPTPNIRPLAARCSTSPEPDAPLFLAPRSRLNLMFRASGFHLATQDLVVTPDEYPLAVEVEIPSRDALYVPLDPWAESAPDRYSYVTHIGIMTGHGDDWIVRVNGREALRLLGTIDGPDPEGFVPPPDTSLFYPLLSLANVLDRFMWSLAPGANATAWGVGVAVEEFVTAWIAFASDADLSPDELRIGNALAVMANEVAKTSDPPRSALREAFLWFSAKADHFADEFAGAAGKTAGGGAVLAVGALATGRFNDLKIAIGRVLKLL